MSDVTQEVLTWAIIGFLVILSAYIGHKARNIDKAVNSRPSDEPKLYDLVKDARDASRDAAGYARMSAEAATSSALAAATTAHEARTTSEMLNGHLTWHLRNQDGYEPSLTVLRGTKLSNQPEEQPGHDD